MKTNKEIIEFIKDYISTVLREDTFYESKATFDQDKQELTEIESTDELYEIYPSSIILVNVWFYCNYDGCGWNISQYDESKHPVIEETENWKQKLLEHICTHL